MKQYPTAYRPGAYFEPKPTKGLPGFQRPPPVSTAPSGFLTYKDQIAAYLRGNASPLGELLNRRSGQGDLNQLLDKRSKLDAPIVVEIPDYAAGTSRSDPNRFAGPSWLQAKRAKKAAPLVMPFKTNPLNLIRSVGGFTPYTWAAQFALNYGLYQVALETILSVVPVPHTFTNAKLLAECSTGRDGDLTGSYSAYMSNTVKSQINNCLSAQAFSGHDVSTWMGAGAIKNARTWKVAKLTSGELHSPAARYRLTAGWERLGTSWSQYVAPRPGISPRTARIRSGMAPPASPPPNWFALRGPLPPPPPIIPTRISMGIGGPGGRPQMSYEQSNYHFKPRRNEKETKKFFLGPGKSGVVAAVVGFHGEFGDMTEALYSTLPLYLKSKDADTIAERFAILIKHADRIQPKKAFANLLVNEIGDRAAATTGKNAASFNQRIKSPIGVQMFAQQLPFSGRQIGSGEWKQPGLLGYTQNMRKKFL